MDTYVHPLVSYNLCDNHQAVKERFCRNKWSQISFLAINSI